MASNTNNIPPNAVQILFAEDLINRILFRHNGTHYKPWRAGPYRDFTFNGFNEEIQKAVDFIDMTIEWEIDEEFYRLAEMHDVDEDAFVHYAAYYGFFYFPVGFDANYFLYYCVRLVSLAAHFIQFNVPRAPDIALYFILKALEGYDMFKGGWDTLNNVAKIFLKAYEGFSNILTPDGSDEESLVDGSDEESLVDGSDEESLVDGSDEESLVDGSDEDADQSEENEVNSYFLNREDLLVTNQLEILKKEQVYEMDGLLALEEGLKSSESTESKRDSKSGLSLKTQLS